MAEKTYRLLRGTHSRRDPKGGRLIFVPGDVLVLSASELAAFGDKFEDADGAKPSSGQHFKIPGATPRIKSQAEIQAEKDAAKAAAAESAEAEIQAIAGDATRSAVINLVGEKPGTALIKAGFASLAALDAAPDKEILAVPGVGKAALKKIREA